MRPHTFVAVFACVAMSGQARGDTLRWGSPQVDADARVVGNTDEVQLLVAVSYLRVTGAPYVRGESRAGGLRFAYGIGGAFGGVATRRCTLGVDCFVARLGPVLQLEWSTGSVRRSEVRSDRAVFASVMPHAGWVDVGSGLGGFEAGVSAGAGVAFPVTGKNSVAGDGSPTIVTVQALATMERACVFLGLGLGVSLR